MERRPIKERMSFIIQILSFVMLAFLAYGSWTIAVMLDEALIYLRDLAQVANAYFLIPK